MRSAWVVAIDERRRRRSGLVPVSPARSVNRWRGSREHEPLLGEHLDRTIRTGTYCAYVPDPRAPAGWGV